MSSAGVTPHLLSALLLIAGCRAASPSVQGTGDPRLSVPRAPTARPDNVAVERPEVRPADPLEPVMLVSALPTLRALEERSLDLGSQLVGAPARTTSELSKHARYRVLEAAVRADLEQDRRRDARAGVGMRYAHRQFDARWLSSEHARFELIAVVNRLDRRPFSPEHCGEVRLIYRLSYTVTTRTGRVDSRLPMTVNLVRHQPSDGRDCADVARRWLAGNGQGEDVAWLTADTGPLAPARLAAAPLKSVELNFQSVRWPSTVRPNLGGHAEYVLRVFHSTDTAPFLQPARLENTLDTERLARDRRLRAALLSRLTEPQTLAELDRGTLKLPDEFLAKRAISVSPHGLERSTNRPFARAFAAHDFEGLTFAGFSTLHSAASMLRRLDGLSCPGCHQSRSLAGFHWLGEEDADKAVDALHVPRSPHLDSELRRRAAYVAALARGEAPEELRPPAEHAPDDNGVGAHCALAEEHYDAWQCAEGLRCARTGGSEIGTCLPEAGPSVGDACEYGTLSFTDAHRDDARLSRVTCQGGRVCEASSVGFPSGMCAGSCDELPEGAVCGGIALLTEFNACLAAGRAFDRCVLENTRPGALRACSMAEPCRDDYVCARAPRGGGACMPPYFLFQLRVDGHPL